MTTTIRFNPWFNGMMGINGGGKADFGLRTGVSILGLME